jgi:hypothetical protein
MLHLLPGMPLSSMAVSIGSARPAEGTVVQNEGSYVATQIFTRSDDHRHGRRRRVAKSTLQDDDHIILTASDTTGAWWPKARIRSMNSARPQCPLAPKTTLLPALVRNYPEYYAADVCDPDRYSFEVVHKSWRAPYLRFNSALQHGSDVTVLENLAPPVSRVSRTAPSAWRVPTRQRESPGWGTASETPGR